MPRHLRIREPGLLRHVMSRGNGRMQIFLDDRDYQKFLYILGAVLDEWDVDCWDACLMPNHYHLTLMNRQQDLARAMQHLNGEYATWWNKQHGTVGHVFQGRYKDQIVQREGYLLSLTRYIALNPVRARLVTSPELWPWSAYRCIAGLAANPGFLCTDFLLAQFGEGTRAFLRERYIQHVHAGLAGEDDLVRQFRSRHRILGDRDFKKRVLSPSKTDVLVAESATSSAAIGV